VRENVFNVLTGAVRGAVVLDLFAGTGGYGLEALSRGAARVIFNDADRHAAEVIGKNLAAVSSGVVEGCSAQVLNLDFREAIKRVSGSSFDLIFIDPPYDSGFGAEAIALIAKHNLLAVDGTIVFETDAAHEYAPYSAQIDVKIKKYGRAKVYFLKRAM
jgi:16S rRNA (guanine966-N2)-methyltransferase